MAGNYKLFELSSVLFPHSCRIPRLLTDGFFSSVEVAGEYIEVWFSAYCFLCFMLSRRICYAFQIIRVEQTLPGAWVKSLVLEGITLICFACQAWIAMCLTTMCALWRFAIGSNIKFTHFKNAKSSVYGISPTVRSHRRWWRNDGKFRNQPAQTCID